MTQNSMYIQAVSQKSSLFAQTNCGRRRRFQPKSSYLQREIAARALKNIYE